MAMDSFNETQGLVEISMTLALFISFSITRKLSIVNIIQSKL